MKNSKFLSLCIYATLFSMTSSGFAQEIEIPTDVSVPTPIPSEMNSWAKDSPDVKDPADIEAQERQLEKDRAEEKKRIETLEAQKTEESKQKQLVEELKIKHEDQAILDSPTQSVEAYERTRKKRLYELSLPNWAYGVTIAPSGFRKADLRVPSIPGYERDRPVLYGVLISGDWVAVNHYGILSLGATGGIYGNPKKYENFEPLVWAFLSLGPAIEYQFAYWFRQWVVPFVRLEYEFVRYHFKFNNQLTRGTRGIPRYDIGLNIFLNSFEPNSAGMMYSNYGIKRTYLTASYTSTRDAVKHDIDLSEVNFRLGFRFEL